MGRKSIIAIVAIAIAALLLTTWKLTRDSRGTESEPEPYVATPTATEPAAAVPDAATVPPQSTAEAPHTAPTATATAATAPPPPSAVSLGMRIGLGEAFERISAGSVYVLDVRDVESYRRGHVPNALHIPLPQVEAELWNLPRDKPILTYCT